MKSRCLYPTDKGYIHYGGRGIKLCSEWHSFVPFYEWAIKNGYRDDLTIERINVNGDYEPSNCTFIPRCDQAKNKTNTVRIYDSTGNGLSIKELSLMLGISQKTIYDWRKNEGIKTLEDFQARAKIMWGTKGVKKKHE
ncbi:hypothetical protein SDC9_67336 [bioreactor metagenome]|uniref:Uncharacterized protein n=1 Tax=bioreactor metagenome TaxID=1076179 RepID=A0A644XYM4_9ZZZZ